MDIGRHQLTECRIDRTVLGEHGKAAKRFGADHDAEMAATVACAFVAGVFVTVIDHIKTCGMECRIEAGADFGHALLARERHGSALRNGRTSTRS